VLTAPPSAELVARVRDLYHTRVSDVRFLIPVLNGLTKKEVVAALPKLIKLNPVVVKEVFNRFILLCISLIFQTYMYFLNSLQAYPIPVKAD
jgi:hypothetical protein